MEIVVCPQCRSRNIRQASFQDGELGGYTTRDVCKNCGYVGMPIIFESKKEYLTFLETIPST